MTPSVALPIAFESDIVQTVENNKDNNKSKVRIGIPRALLFHKYGKLWEAFFRELGCDVIVSPETNKDIVARGINHTVDETCLSVKIYVGHVDWLQDKADYVFVPNIVCLHRGEELCVKFLGLVDIIRNTYPKTKILEYTVDSETRRNETTGLIAVGTKLTGNPVKAVAAYLKARNKFRDELAKKISTQHEQVQTGKDPDAISILVASHPYTTYDNFLGRPIINYLTKLGVNIIYSDRLESAMAKELSKNIAKTLYWSYHKELLGAVEYYKKHADGIIFLTTFPCGPDSLIINLCQSRMEKIPNILITLDELESGVGLQTRLESFVDIIKLQKSAKVKQ